MRQTGGTVRRSRAVAMGLLALVIIAAPAWSAFTQRVSISSAGVQGNADSRRPFMSADGRFIGFNSEASNLVPNDANAVEDAFLHDMITGTTQCISVSMSGVPAGGYGTAITPDGRFVVFGSSAANIVTGDANSLYDVFVRDRLAGTTQCISVSLSSQSAGGGGGSISDDGRFVAFYSSAGNLVPGDTNASYDVFVRDRPNWTTERVSLSSAAEQGNDDSFSPSISADGRFVAFCSRASNLVPGDANGESDVFVRDRQTGVTQCISVSSAGELGNNYSCCPVISADGTAVVFFSPANNLIPDDTSTGLKLFIHYRATGVTERVFVLGVPEAG